MRILMTTHPGYGHFHPLVPLARALGQAGHEVAFATAPSFRSAIEDNGFGFFPAGIDWQSLGPGHIEMQKRQAALQSASLEERLDIMSDMFIKQFGPPMLPDLLHLGESWQPQLIVRDNVEFAGAVAAEKLGLPHASVHIGGSNPAILRHPIVSSKLDVLRGSVGLPADPGAEMLFRYLHLSFVPPRFIDERGASLPTGHFLRPAIFDQSGNEKLPAWAENLGARPVVYLTLGTVFNKMFFPFQAIISALRDEPIELIVTVGRDLDPALLGEQPANVHIERYIPQTLLFPKCNAAILHGGFNSVISALCHGLPLLIVPLGADQPLNAARCQALGVGQALYSQDLNPERIRTAVRALLADSSYREQAQRFAAEAQKLPGIEHAVALLERLVVEKRPQLASA